MAIARLTAAVMLLLAGCTAQFEMPAAPTPIPGARVIAGPGPVHESVVGVFLGLRSWRETGPGTVGAQ